mgnify:FL=1
MKLLLLLILLLPKYLVACTICDTEIPLVTVNAEITAKEKTTAFDIEWNFHQEFVSGLTQYDTNENQKFDKEEQLLIKESLISYIKELHYLTDIEYKHKNKLTESNYIDTITPTSSELYFENDTMVLRYKFDLEIIFKNRHSLYLGFNDEGGNFNFVLKNVTLHNYPHSYILDKDSYSSKITFNNPNSVEKIEEVTLENVELVTSEEQINIPQPQEKEKTYLEILAEKLTEIKNSLKSVLIDIKENNSLISYFWLLLFSFLYGIIHAVGPGHGKSLVSSYFINQEKSYIKAFTVASLIGVVHTFSAFIMTLVVYYSVGFIFNSTIVNIEQITTKVSAVIIISIALYLMYKKLSKTKQKFTFTQSKSTTSFVTTPNIQHTQNLSCACNSCKTTSTDLGVILAAGIIPCPGTITVFLFTMSLGIYFVGFLSAVFMSLGMSLIIFITAVISVKIRKTAVTNTLLLKVMEYGSLIFILFLGILLLTVV